MQFRYSIERALDSNPHVVIVGDINVDLSASTTNPLTDIMHAFQLQNIITAPTRVSLTRASLLDPIIISDACSYSFSDVIDVDRDISDHKACVVDFNFGTSPNSCTRKVWCYKDADYEKFNNLINNVDWIEVLNTDSVNESCDVFINKYIELAEKCIPRKTITIRHNDKPWFATELRREGKEIGLIT